MNKGLGFIIAAVIALAMAFTMLMPAEAAAASKPGQVKSLKVSSKSYNSLKVSWKKVTGATGYQVYRATSKNGKYKKVKTTKSTSYTNGKLTTGKKYYYKVRAYKGSKKGSYSSKKYGIPKLKTPSLKASASSSSVKLSWGKVSGAKGYQVYRATSKGGKYTKVKTTSSTSYTNSGLSVGKTYYYKVRAYRKVGKSTKYSSYSAVRPATTKKKTAAKAPDPYAAVDMAQVNADIEKAKKSGKDILRSVNNVGYSYYIHPYTKTSHREGVYIGYLDKWLDQDSYVNGCEPGKWYGANYALKVRDSQCVVYYTLDGSTPSLTNGTKVTKSSGLIKIKAQHTGDYGDVNDTLNLKTHCYVKSKLVAISYHYGDQEMCLH